jgi:subtilisin family serine protease
MRYGFARAAAGGLVVALLATPGQPAAASPGKSTFAAPGASTLAALGASTFAGPPEQSVTLITGDRVVVSRDGQAVRPIPGKGRERVRFFTQRHGKHVYVMPSDATAMIGSGQLDRRLFDVAGLIESGYSDAHRPYVPLIMTYPDGQDRARATAATAGATPVRTLSTIDGVAVRAAKGPQFWSALQAGGNTHPGGAGRIWLDGTRRPLLDRSVPQIGAPAAWAAGYTGAGVTVAVLDTGIKADHPDLAGKVAEARNFTESPAGDFAGHGTHVASTIAGTGAASAGRYRGVAPDATLLDGKVCGDFFCEESAILAAMEWAAVEKGAQVVNLSLGGPDTPGNDPLEEAVNRLTAEHGTLFVIAAGNAGECSESDRVASPGSAEAALTVGAVDPADRLAAFSCQGPTIGDQAIKPDITAPGVGIVAARAAGTQVGDLDPVDENYARASGTSMATPHVAGAAALLAQQHPGWRAAQLKATLMASAKVSTGVSAFGQGAGRVDAARAIGQTLTSAPPSVSLAMQSWPHDDDAPITRTLAFRNAGPAGQTLSLRLDVTGPDGRPAPAGTFTLDAAPVTVPAGGEASVTVTADTSVEAPDGRYTGWIVANSGSGATVRTPIAVEREVESYDITLRALDRQGAETDFIGEILTPGEPLFVVGLGPVTLRIPRGEYAFAFVVAGGQPEASVLSGARLAVREGTELLLDARAAKPIEVKPPRESAGLPFGAVGVLAQADSYAFVFGVFVSNSYDGVLMGNVGPSGDPSRFASYVYGDWLEPGPNGLFLNSPYTYHLTYFSAGRVFDGLVRRPQERDLAVVRAEHPSPAGRVGFKIDFVRPETMDITTPALSPEFTLPATRTEFYTTEGARWRTEVTRSRLDGQDLVPEALFGATWRGYRKGPQTERWGVGVFGPALPEPWFPEVWVRQFPQTLVFAVPMYSGAMPGHYGDVLTDTARTVIYRNGVRVAESERAGFVLYEAPAAAGEFRVDTEATQSVFDTSTRMTASWRFRSRPVPGPDGQPLPVLAVRFLPVLDNENRAPGGVRYAIPITVERHPGAPEAKVSSLSVEVSYDDGRHWHRVPVKRTGAGWTAPVEHPRTGFVSLRAKAVAADGSSVEQTIIRGYGLRSTDCRVAARRAV